MVFKTRKFGFERGFEGDIEGEEGRRGGIIVRVRMVRMRGVVRTMVTLALSGWSGWVGFGGCEKPG